MKCLNVLLDIELVDSRCTDNQRQNHCDWLAGVKQTMCHKQNDAQLSEATPQETLNLPIGTVFGPASHEIRHQGDAY